MPVGWVNFLVVHTPSRKQSQQEPEVVSLIDRLAKSLNEKKDYPFKRPAWDRVRDWQRDIERGPQPLPGLGPAPVAGPAPWWVWVFSH